MAEFIPVEPFDIVIFGGSGDLSKRKLIPALFHRFLDGQISDMTRIIGAARSEWSTQDFRDFGRSACLAAQSDDFDSEGFKAFEKLLHFVPLDSTDDTSNWSELRDLIHDDNRPRIFYLALAPRLYIPTCNMLGAKNLVSPTSRVVLEKPIGRDLATAREINEGVGAVFEEEQIFRIDHYLGKETVQNLLVLRFANMLFEPLWSRDQIDHVQITVAESVGVAERADYYDRSGAVRDMVQNHLLQLLCLTAMEPPNSLDADEIRGRKIQVLNALQPFTPETAKANSVRAQYREGSLNGETVSGYQDELTDNLKGSKTETFVALKTEIKNWRWEGVPFYLRTGKRMQSRHSEIVIHFKHVAHSIFGGQDRHSPNKLVVRLQPDEGVHLYVQIKEPGPGGLRLNSLPLNLTWAESFTCCYPDAYERLLMDVVRGNLALFMQRDEVEKAWEWVDSLLSAWEQNDQPIENYAAGTQGPHAASSLLAVDNNRQWTDPDEGRTPAKTVKG